MNPSAVFQKWIFLVIVVTLMNVDAIAEDVQGIWHEGVYQVDTISLADEVKAIWIVASRTTNNPNHHSFNAKDLLEHFFKQPKEQQRHGIFIYSKSYAIPDTLEERRWMSEYLLKRNGDPEWRKSEASLVEELRLACEKQGIPLFVNLSINLQGKWRVLNNPKSSAQGPEKPSQAMEKKKP